MRVLRAAFSNFAVFAILGFILPAATHPQSTDQNHPTPITSTELSGTIKVRDIGDSRLTSYFYAFEGSQGDVFINVVTKNFSGDIDVFSAEGLRPLAKMVVYADSGTYETGRLIYLRKGERLVLRIEGRSPNDDPADFRIKFGGSFIALAPQKADDGPTITRTGSEESTVRVNSVGTIIPAPPKPRAARNPKEVLAESVKPAEERIVERAPPISDPPPVKKTDSETGPKTVFGNKSAKVTVAPAIKADAKPPPRATTAKTTKSAAKATKPPPEVKEKAPDPLASIRLIVQLKDGESIERPMSEVVKFSVDKGILTVILKDGKIAKYSILDVARVTIE